MLSAILLPALAVSILAPYIATAMILNGCTSNQFECQDGGCIDRTLMCDGAKDCEDNSDEIFNTCYNTTCNEDSLFRCNYGGCVNIEKQCNGVNDCWDKSDENAFLCANDKELDILLADMLGNCSSLYALQCKGHNKCLMWSQVCNGRSDCSGDYDESAYICGGSLCPANTFRCESGACINANMLCNHDIDCADGSDEVPDICVKPKRNSVKKNENGISNENVWMVDSCRLTPKTGMHVMDYFSEFSYRPDALVPDKTIVAVTCDSGYEIFGQTFNECDNGKWLNDFNCVPSCDQSVHVRNVSYSTQCFFNYDLVDCQLNMQTRDTKMLVSCAPGYRASSQPSQVGEHSCNKHGDWSIENENPNCEPICGIKSPQHPDKSPWTVSIFKRDSSMESNYSFKCSGTILSPFIVITSAECFSKTIHYTSLLDYAIVEGNHSVRFNLDEDHGYVLHNILNIHIATFKTQYKAAILTLIKPFRFNALVRPICLNAIQAPNDDENVAIAEVFEKPSQLGEGLTNYENYKHTLKHIVAGESKIYNIEAFVTAIRSDIAKSEQNP